MITAGRISRHFRCVARVGAGLGGLLNATFGNAAELIIALVALRKGLHGVVKASLAGSIIGNILLVLGLAILCGGLKYRRQTFNSAAAGLGATLLALSAAGLLVPALFHWIYHSNPQAAPLERTLSLEIAVVLFVTYGLSLLFQLHTHQHLFAGDPHAAETEHGPGWSVRKSATVLVAVTTLVAMESEMLVGAVEHTAETWGLSEVFIGVILVAIIGNAAEHSTAVLMAIKNKMDLAMNIAIGSSIQVALFVAPVLVFAGYLFGQPMDLVFTPFEVLAVGLSVGVLSLVAQDGESHWMEGVLLLALYVVLGFAFYSLP